MTHIIYTCYSPRNCGWFPEKFEVLTPRLKMKVSHTIFKIPPPNKEGIFQNRGIWAHNMAAFLLVSFVNQHEQVPSPNFITLLVFHHSSQQRARLRRFTKQQHDGVDSSVGPKSPTSSTKRRRFSGLEVPAHHPVPRAQVRAALRHPAGLGRAVLKAQRALAHLGPEKRGKEPTAPPNTSVLITP